MVSKRDEWIANQNPKEFVNNMTAGNVYALGLREGYDKAIEEVLELFKLPEPNPDPGQLNCAYCGDWSDDCDCQEKLRTLEKIKSLREGL